MPNLDALVLLLVVCNNERQSLSIEYEGGTPKKSMEGHIKSDADIMKEKHEEELRKMQEKEEWMRKELDERMRKERELEERLEQVEEELMKVRQERKRSSGSEQQERVTKRQV